jgi:hypothetical protein
MDRMTKYKCLCESTQCEHHSEDDCHTTTGTFIQTRQLGSVCATCFRNYDEAGYPLTIDIAYCLPNASCNGCGNNFDPDTGDGHATWCERYEQV